MIKVQSLKHTIIAQFTLILLPVVALLVFQTWQDAYRAADMAQLVRLHGLAQKAQERFGVFSAGAVAAEKSSAVNLLALSALWDARHALDELGRRSQAPDLLESAKQLTVMAEALEANPGLRTLRTLQEPLQTEQAKLQGVVADYDRRLNDQVHGSIHQSVTSTQIVVCVSIATLLLTIWCVFRMIHYLSQPLTLAVSIADRIAAGDTVDEKDFDLRIDVGNLIHSLGTHVSQSAYLPKRIRRASPEGWNKKSRNSRKVRPAWRRHSIWRRWETGTGICRSRRRGGRTRRFASWAWSRANANRIGAITKSWWTAPSRRRCGNRCAG